MKKSSFGKTNEVETYRKYNETPLHWVSTVKLPIQFICKIRVLDMNKLYIELYNFILWMFVFAAYTDICLHEHQNATPGNVALANTEYNKGSITPFETNG